MRRSKRDKIIRRRKRNNIVLYIHRSKDNIDQYKGMKETTKEEKRQQNFIYRSERDRIIRN